MLLYSYTATLVQVLPRPSYYVTLSTFISLIQPSESTSSLTLVNLADHWEIVGPCHSKSSYPLSWFIKYTIIRGQGYESHCLTVVTKFQHFIVINLLKYNWSYDMF